jgi:hypothetical protein
MPSFQGSRDKGRDNNVGDGRSISQAHQEQTAGAQDRVSTVESGSLGKPADLSTQANGQDAASAAASARTNRQNSRLLPIERVNPLLSGRMRLCVLLQHATNISDARPRPGYTRDLTY